MLRSVCVLTSSIPLSRYQDTYASACSITCITATYSVRQNICREHNPLKLLLYKCYRPAIHGFGKRGLRTTATKNYQILLKVFCLLSISTTTNLLRYLVSRCHWRVKTADQLKRAAIELWKVPTEVLGNICRLAWEAFKEFWSLFKIAQRLSFSRKTRMPAYQANPDQAPGGLHSLETGWGLWKGWTNHPLLDIVYTMYYNKNQTICMCFLDALITVTVRPRLLDTVTIRLTKVYILWQFLPQKWTDRSATPKPLISTPQKWV